MFGQTPQYHKTEINKTLLIVDKQLTEQLVKPVKLS